VVKLKTVAALSVLLVLALGAAVMAVAAERQYDPGVSDTEIVIGQTMPLSGPLSGYATFAKAETAYFSAINDVGGVSRRKLRLISLDDGYNPAKTVEQTRKLVEQEHVFLLFSSFGTVTTAAIHKYANDNKVPLLFPISGAGKWADPERYPRTMGWMLPYRTEARIYARHLLQNRPAAKIAVLYQDDDYGKEYLRGLEEELGGAAEKMIAAEVSYQPSDPTVDSQIVTLQASGADTFMIFATAKSAAQAIRKAYDIGWRPQRFLTYTSASVATVLKPAGFDKSAGIISAGFAKDPTDPQWRNDEAVRDWRVWMEKYYPDGDVADIANVYGYSLAQTLVQILRQCDGALTRENVMRQAANLQGVELPMLLPGIRLDTSPSDFYPIEQAQMMRFDGAEWVRFGGILRQ
jgi:branched-chain amino acid transport system substrate-binding protein